MIGPSDATVMRLSGATVTVMDVALGAARPLPTRCQLACAHWTLAISMYDGIAAGIACPLPLLLLLLLAACLTPQ
eukprot:14568724-Alexandrium_andersonii.AAC.1